MSACAWAHIAHALGALGWSWGELSAMGPMGPMHCHSCKLCLHHSRHQYTTLDTYTMTLISIDKQLVTLNV